MTQIWIGSNLLQVTESPSEVADRLRVPGDGAPVGFVFVTGRSGKPILVNVSQVSMVEE